jgi:hypothetical protein
VEVILLILNSIADIGELITKIDLKAGIGSDAFFTTGTDGAGKLLGRAAVIVLGKEVVSEKESSDFPIFLAS